MNLSPSEVALFYELWYELNWSVNQKYGIVPKFNKPNYGQLVGQHTLITIRNAIWKNPHWIDEFLNDNEFGALNKVMRDTLARWSKEFVAGRFIVMQHTDKYSVFMNADKNDTLYGVCGISNSFKKMIPSALLPYMVETVLVPFKDKIIYDSLLNTFNISFGNSMRSGFKESYSDIKKKQGVIEQLGSAPVAEAN